MEYSSHPSSPPPPEAITPQSEKPRVIIVAVRKSGRVRMHKSKENANGTFSIGKTWDLNDLTGIESFTSTSVDPRKRQWAGDTGFTVVIGKPYFWQCSADKEKKFFIASLIKIYSKYTGGKLPELHGFDPREQDQVLGSRRPPTRNAPVAETAPPSSLRPGISPAQSEISVSKTPIQAYQPPPRRPASPSRGLIPPNGMSASPASSVGSRDPSLPPPPSLRRLAGNNPSQDSLASRKSEDASSIPPRSRGGMNGPGAFARFGDRDREQTGTPPAQSQQQVPPPLQVPPPGPAPQFDLPDRRRPPMDPSRPQNASVDNDLVPAPLMSPGFRKDSQSLTQPPQPPQELSQPQPPPPPRNAERMSPRKPAAPSRMDNSSIATALNEPETPLGAASPVMPTPSPGTPPFVSATPSPAPVEKPKTPPPPPAEPEESRPGLGPMIKSKKSKGELAGALWKAASAVSAFKPRPGGAGERLRELKRSDSDGPDGITEVVPAPPRPVLKPEPPKAVEPPKSPKRNSNNVPEVKITVPNSSRPSSLQPSVAEQTKIAEVVKKPAEEPAITGNDAKYLTTLGIDSNILAGQTDEFIKLLDHFGWVPGEKMRSRNFEEMKMDVDRQLNKAQAGDWVVRFEEEDERIDAIKRGLDVAIAECDELDNLLTLYSVELGVSKTQPWWQGMITNFYLLDPV